MSRVKLVVEKTDMEGLKIYTCFGIESDLLITQLLFQEVKL